MRPKVASSRRQARSTPAFILDCEPRCYLAATLVADINTRPVPDFLPTEVFSTGDLAYFFKNDGVHGTELWRTDGTTAGTALFKDIYPGPGSSSAGASAPSFSRAPDGTVYFGASDGVSGAELWKTDGTAAGTLMVTDVRPGEVGSAPFGITATPAGVFFYANDGVHGNELWFSDGTAAGTRLVADLNPGAGNQYGQPLAFAGGRPPPARRPPPHDRRTLEDHRRPRRPHPPRHQLRPQRPVSETHRLRQPRLRQRP
jgi:ELWxxDGT repeat protein